MNLICYTGINDKIYHHYEKKYLPYGECFNDVVDFEELIWYKRE